MADLPAADLAETVDRAWARCEAAVHDAIREMDGDAEAATLLGLALTSRLAGHFTREVLGAGGRTSLADLDDADPEEVRWALEAIASLDLEALADATSATLVLKRRLS